MTKLSKKFHTPRGSCSQTIPHQDVSSSCDFFHPHVKLARHQMINKMKCRVNISGSTRSKWNTGICQKHVPSCLVSNPTKSSLSFIFGSLWIINTSPSGATEKYSAEHYSTIVLPLGAHYLTRDCLFHILCVQFKCGHLFGGNFCFGNFALITFC